MEGEEDCLILNIFVPKVNYSYRIQRHSTRTVTVLNMFFQLGPKAPLLPVMVWIHGGYFSMGSSLEYSGEIFMDENVVLVTINYRLGAMGMTDFQA